MGQGQRVYILNIVNEDVNKMIGIYSNISQVRRIQINYNISHLTLKECRINNSEQPLIDRTYLLKQLPTHLEYSIKKEQIKKDLIKQVSSVNTTIADIVQDISIDNMTFIQEQPVKDNKKKSKYQHKNKDKYICKNKLSNQECVL